MKKNYKNQLIRILISGLIFSSIAIFVFSCNSREVQIQEPVLKTDTCSNDHNNTYSLYIPSHERNCGSMPLVIILDPKGLGAIAINKFLAGAESYKCVLAASNLVKNNYPDFVPAIETLVADVRTKYPVGTKVYLVGFSGGARIAITTALLRKVNGVLVSGALGSEEDVSTIKTNVYAVFGLGDFNLHEAANFFLNPSGYPSNLKIELTNNKHEWPSESNLNRALGMLILSDYPKESTCIKKSTILKNYSAECKKLVDSLMQSEDYLNAYFLCTNVQTLKDLPEKSYFNKLYQNLKNDAKLNHQLYLIRLSMQQEFKARDGYTQDVHLKDNNWWLKELTSLNKEIDQEKDRYKLYALKRIQAFLGIMCYSLTTNALRTNNLEETRKILKLYKIVEPQNPDMFYFFAVYLSKTGKNDSVVSYLHKAINAGYLDLNSIQGNFPPEVSKQFIKN
jgi:hypothetical protein